MRTITDLLRNLESRSTQTRVTAAEKLMYMVQTDMYENELRSSGGLRVLIKCLRDESPRVRDTIITTLEVFQQLKDILFLQQHGGLSQIINCLNDRDSLVRASAAGFFSNIVENDSYNNVLKQAHVIRQLLKLLSDRQPRVRGEAIYSLKRLTEMPMHLQAFKTADGISILKQYIQQEPCEGSTSCGREILQRESQLASPVTQKSKYREFDSVDDLFGFMDDSSDTDYEQGLPTASGVEIISYSEISYKPDRDFIARGGFGRVYRAKWRGKAVALKILLFQGMGPDAIQELKHEGQMMARLRHPNVIHFFGACIEQGHYALVMEYMDKGSLYKLLQDEGESLLWQRRTSIAYGVGNGLAYLHSQNVLHRDLKSLNVLMSRDYQPKIGDFGLSKIKQETSRATSKGGAIGTLAWMAPELLKAGQKYQKSCDIYSLAIILWEIVSGKAPGVDVDMPRLILGMAAQGRREVIPSRTPSRMAALISKCWAKEPTKRPEIREIVSELEAIKTTP